MTKRVIFNLIILLLTLSWFLIINFFKKEIIDFNDFLMTLSINQLNLINISRTDNLELNYYLVIVNIFVYLYSIYGAALSTKLLEKTKEKKNFKLEIKKKQKIKLIIIDTLKIAIWQIINLIVTYILVLSLKINLELIDIFSINLYLILLTYCFYFFTLLLQTFIKIKQVKYISVIFFLVLRILFLSLNLKVTFINPYTIINIKDVITYNQINLSEIFASICFILISYTIYHYISLGKDDD